MAYLFLMNPSDLCGFSCVYTFCIYNAIAYAPLMRPSTKLEAEDILRLIDVSFLTSLYSMHDCGLLGLL